MRPRCHPIDDSWAEPQVDVAILGDLHLCPTDVPLFEDARDHFQSHFTRGSSGRVVQLGDLGGYDDQPGSRACFQTARRYLESFQVPYALVTGNHDVEGAEFDTDEANLAAWVDTFDQPLFWAKRLPGCIMVGMSTVRYRSNVSSHHEVYIDEAQLAGLERLLAEHPATPFVICTHAPPQGAGLTVVPSVHVKNRCAWINHSDPDSGRLIRLVRSSPNIRLWFSGHYHLCHDYADSISVVGSCAFIQVGVIGGSHRDGRRQSRLLRCREDGYEVHTLAHDSGALRLDLAQSWGEGAPPEPATLPPSERCEELDWTWRDRGAEAAPADHRAPWVRVGPTQWLLHQAGMIVEYDEPTRAPVGVVFLDTAGCEMRFVDEAGEETEPTEACTLQLCEDPSAADVTKAVPRNDSGGFFKIYQRNKWQLKRDMLMA